MSNVTIRASTRADIPAIDALLALAYPVLLKPDYPPSVLVTALPLISRANPALIGSGSYYVAELDGVIRAAGGWSKAARQGQEAEDWGHIRHVVTHPDTLRQGLARRLMEASFHAAGEAGLAGLVCLSTRTAVPFYRSVGFAADGPEMDLTLRPGIEFPAQRMLRSL